MAKQDEILDMAIQNVIQTADGKRVFMWLLEMAGIYAEPFAGQGGNDITNYALGRQSIGRKIIARLEDIEPSLYPRLLFDAKTIRDADMKPAAIRGNPSDGDGDHVDEMADTE